MTIACTLKEGDEMIVSSVSSVLLQGTATTRNSLTTIAAVSTGRTTLRCWERGGVQEMSTKLIVKFHSAFPARIAHPAVSEFGARAERVDHGLDQKVADGKLRQKSEPSRGCAGDRPVEQRPRREDQRSRRPYSGCGAQFGCVIA